jgi:ketosteroid isomerase-like protein
MSNLERARAYLRAIERGDPGALAFYAPDVTQTEFPNRLVPDGAVRDLAALRDAAERGKRAILGQSYEITRAVEQGDDLALEVTWTATVAVPIGDLPAGGTMRAHFAMFLTFRDGLIVTQHNYDCFDEF